MQAASDVPGKFTEHVDQLESAIHHVAESANRGEWDFQPYAHPEVEIGTDESN